MNELIETRGPWDIGAKLRRKRWAIADPPPMALQVQRELGGFRIFKLLVPAIGRRRKEKPAT